MHQGDKRFIGRAVLSSCRRSAVRIETLDCAEFFPSASHFMPWILPPLGRREFPFLGADEWDALAGRAILMDKVTSCDMGVYTMRT
jgi:hypothetical protein